MTTAEICHTCKHYKKRWTPKMKIHECKGCFRKRTGLAPVPPPSKRALKRKSRTSTSPLKLALKRLGR